MGKTATELRWEIDQRRADLSRDFEMLGDKVSPGRIYERRTSAVRSRFRNVRESVMGKADVMSTEAQRRAIDLRTSAGDTSQGIMQSTQDTMHSVSDTVRQAPQFVEHQTQGNPLAVGLVAFGMGLLAATLIPQTRREQDFASQLQPHLQDAARSIGSTGREMVDELKPMAQDAAQQLQSSAKESAQHVADSAKSAAQDVKQDAQSAASNVKDAART